MLCRSQEPSFDTIKNLPTLMICSYQRRLETTKQQIPRSIIRRWHNALFTEEIKKKLGITERQATAFIIAMQCLRPNHHHHQQQQQHDYPDQQVYSSATLLELDDIYTRRLAGFPNLPGPISTIIIIIIKYPLCLLFMLPSHPGDEKSPRFLQCDEL